MSKAVKTRRCPQCAAVIKSANLKALMKHVESSAICKDAIRNCESCLMKFPDDSLLLKHMSLKKGCQDTYNMGVMDPSITLEDQPVRRGKKDGILCNVAYYSSGTNKRKKLHISDDVHNPVKAGTVTNSHATYVFPHYHSKTQQPSMKYFDHGQMTKLSPSKITYQPVWYANNNLHQDDEYEYFAGDEEAVFSVHSQSDSCDAFSVGSHVDGEYNDSVVEFDDLSADEQDDNVEVIDAGDGLKSLASKIRRRQMGTFHLSPEVQMLMDLYLKTVGRGASLSTFDDVLQWAITHSLVDSHVPTRKPLI
jgi:hypothetical protein